MNKKLRLYTKPFVTGAVLLVLGISMLAYGIIMAGQTHNSDFYALVVFGAIFIISAVVTIFVYGALEVKFQKIINSNTLLDFCIDDYGYKKTAEITANEVKANNKITLFIMLFFFGLLAIVGPFVADDGYLISLISIGLAVFLTLSAIIATKYRVNKLIKGSKRVVLSKKGAYICGEFHCWDMAGSALLKAEYICNGNKNGCIKINYGAITLPAQSVYSFIVPIPKEMEQRAKDIVKLLYN